MTGSMTDKHLGDAWAEQAENGRLLPIKGTALKGEAAAREARETLMAVTHTDSLEAATTAALSSPSHQNERERDTTGTPPPNGDAE